MTDPSHHNLDEVISIIDNNESETINQPDRDYVTALNKASQFIGVENKIIEINNSTDGNFHVAIHLKADTLNHLPILTGYGTDEILSKAKQKAAFTALTLLDKVRYV